LNYIAILDDVTKYIHELSNNGKEGEMAKNDKNEEQVRPPGPWVITVDYKARGKLKTHFIVVKASYILEDNQRKPIFYYLHPSQA
jgi:hypothetical protein